MPTPPRPPPTPPPPTMSPAPPVWTTSPWRSDARPIGTATPTCAANSELPVNGKPTQPDLDLSRHPTGVSRPPPPHRRSLHAQRQLVELPAPQARPAQPAA